jgi:hypothetical protein
MNFTFAPQKGDFQQHTAPSRATVHNSCEFVLTRDSSLLYTFRLTFASSVFSGGDSCPHPLSS